jgi:hypothetical protein
MPPCLGDQRQQRRLGVILAGLRRAFLFRLGVPNCLSQHLTELDFCQRLRTGTALLKFCHSCMWGLAGKLSMLRIGRQRVAKQIFPRGHFARSRRAERCRMRWELLKTLIGCRSWLRLAGHGDDDKGTRVHRLLDREQCSPYRTTADGGSVAGRYRAYLSSRTRESAVTTRSCLPCPHLA